MLRGKRLRPLAPVSIRARWDKAFDKEEESSSNWKTL
jgi:hypothetical protein